MQEEYSKNALLDIFVTLRKYFLGMLITFLSIIVLVVFFTFRQTPIYEVESTVMMKYGREYIYRSIDKFEQGDVPPQYSFKITEWINTELEIFRSRELAEKVLESIGVEKLFPKIVSKTRDRKQQIGKALKRFKKRLVLHHIKESNVILVSFQHESPEIAVQVVNLLTELFQDRHLQIFKNPQTAFLEKQVVFYRRQLQEDEHVLKTYKQENRIFLLEFQQKVLMEQYAKVNTLLIDGNSDLMKWEKKTAALEKELELIPETVVQFKESVDATDTDSELMARSNLLKLKLKESKLMEKYPEGNRLIVAVRKDIETVEKFLVSFEEKKQDRVRKGMNSSFQQLSLQVSGAKADFAAQKAKNEGLQRQLEQLEERLQQLTEQEAKFRELALQTETTGDTYKRFVEKLEDSRIRDAMDRQKMGNMFVIEKATVPVKPIKPNKKMNLLMGIILGGACSLAYVLFRENIMLPKK